MTNADIFRKAADYIREHGWRKGSGGWHWQNGGAVCVEGSLLAACQVPGTVRCHSLDFLHLKRLVADRLGVAAFAVWAWNDLSGSAEKTLALLDGLAFDEDLKAAASSLPAETHRGCEEPANREASPSLLKEAVPVG